MASNQRRTDDLLRLKTRGLIYQYPDGTYPASGSIPYTADASGTVGWSPATTDAQGSLNVPCGLTASQGRFNVDCSSGFVDTLRLTTRGLIYQYPNGTYPASGSIAYTADASGTVGWSPATTDAQGSLNVPCGLSVSQDRFQVDCSSGFVDLYPNTADVQQDSRINLHGSNTQLRLYAQNNPYTGFHEGTIGLAAPPPGGGWLAPVVTFDASNNLLHITNTSGTDIVVVDNSGNVSVNGKFQLTGDMDMSGNFQVKGDYDASGNVNVDGNIKVNGNYDTTGSMQADYLTMPDQNDPTATIAGYVWNEGEILLWQDNSGNTEPLSGWHDIIDPSGCIIPLLDENSTLFDISGTINAILTRLSSKGAFFTTEAIPYPTITFQTPLSITFGWNGSPSGSRTIGPYASQPLNTLVSAINANLAGTPMQLNLNSRTQSVTLECIGDYTYTISDSGIPGSAYLFMNHLGININTPITYVNRVFTVNVNGSSIPPGGIGTAPLPAAPVPTVSAVTTSSITVSWPPVLNASAYAVVLGSTTYAVASQTSYTFTGLTVGTPYTVNVYPLSLYDSGPVGSITKTITSITLDITGTPSWTPTPYSGPGQRNYDIVVATVQPGIWSAQLANLINVNQIQSITLNYYSGYNQPPAYWGDVIFTTKFQGTIPGASPYFLFGYGYRISPTQNADQYAVGSPFGISSPYNINPPQSYQSAAPYTTTGQSEFALAFAPDANGVINRVTPIQFYWWCGYPGTSVYDCKMTGFSVTYVV